VQRAAVDYAQNIVPNTFVHCTREKSLLTASPPWPSTSKHGIIAAPLSQPYSALVICKRTMFWYVYVPGLPKRSRAVLRNGRSKMACDMRGTITSRESNHIEFSHRVRRITSQQLPSLRLSEASGLEFSPRKNNELAANQNQHIDPKLKLVPGSSPQFEAGIKSHRSLTKTRPRTPDHAVSTSTLTLGSRLCTIPSCGTHGQHPRPYPPQKYWNVSNLAAAIGKVLCKHTSNVSFLHENIHVGEPGEFKGCSRT
jgi:hypothetical protein